MGWLVVFCLTGQRCGVFLVCGYCWWVFFGLLGFFLDSARLERGGTKKEKEKLKFSEPTGEERVHLLSQ